MGKSLLFFVAMLGILMIATTSRSDVATDLSTTPPPPIGTGVEAAPEPITGTAITPAPGSQIAPKDPFQPYSIGPATGDKSPKPFWSYEDLTAAEKVVADKGRDTSAWPAIHSAYNTAVAEAAQKAAASSSAAQLGVDNLATTGVVP